MAGMAAYNTNWSGGNWWDRIGGSLEAAGALGMTYGGVSALTGLGLPLGAVLGVGGGAASLLGMAMKSIGGKGDTASDATNPATAATERSANANEVMVSLLSDIRDTLAVSTPQARRDPTGEIATSGRLRVS
jgi:hypothetical protein